MDRRRFLKGGLFAGSASGLMGCAGLLTQGVPSETDQQQSGFYNVIDFGAVGDGHTKDTQAVQLAINTCSENGGGTVYIPPGRKVVIGTIYMKDYVTLHVANGATLLGSPDIEDYATDTHHNLYKKEPHMDRCLIFAKEVKSIAFEGYGTIDGNGFKKHFTRKTGRPMMMRFLKCTDMRMRDITLKNPAAWTSAWLYCSEISVDNIRIHSRSHYNGDGLDFDGCSNVRVCNSSFDNSDDSICLQASMPEYPCRDVVISNCIFETKWGGMRIGLLSRGDFESVCVTNCVFKDIEDSGLKIQMNEGGVMKNMVFSNLTMRNVPRPIFMTFTQQKAYRDAPEEMYPMKAMHNMVFSNIIVDNAKLDKNSVFFLTGMPGKPIKNITLRDIQLTVSGQGTHADAERTNLPEYTLDVMKGWWPEFSKVGTLPASGFYFRHMEGVWLDNVQMTTIEEDARPPVIFDDVVGFDIGRFIVNGKRYQTES